jgi:hypothetical protein
VIDGLLHYVLFPSKSEQERRNLETKLIMETHSQLKGEEKARQQKKEETYYYSLIIIIMKLSFDRDNNYLSLRHSINSRLRNHAISSSGRTTVIV